MTRLASFLTLCIALFCLGVSVNVVVAGQAQPQSSATNIPLPNDKPHGPMPAELVKSLDSKKLKEGDPVSAKITAELHTKEGTTIPRGSILGGHVTEAKARSKGDPQATLAFTFDKLTMPDGKTTDVKGVLQAVAPSLHAGDSGAQSGSIGPGMMAGHEGAGTGTTPPPMPTVSQSSQASVPMLNGQSKGVIGIHNLQLGDNGVLTSTGKEVKLDSGVQMIIQVTVE